MPDISMCTDKECPSRIHCYRYRAIASGRQSFAAFKHTGERCDRYVPTSYYDDQQLTPMSALEPQNQEIP